MVAHSNFVRLLKHDTVHEGMHMRASPTVTIMNVRIRNVTDIAKNN